MAQVTARIVGVEQNVETGWFTILTDDGQVKKLQTKMDQKAREAASFKRSGELVEIEYSAKDSTNTNPHTGQPYRNIYYEKAVAASGATNGASAAHDDGIDKVQPQGRTTNPKDAWRMALSTGSYHAVATLPLMPADQRDFDTQKQIAEAWALWIYRTPPPSDEGTPASVASSGHGAYTNDSFDSPPPPSDDDIPF